MTHLSPYQYCKKYQLIVDFVDLVNNFFLLKRLDLQNAEVSFPKSAINEQGLTIETSSGFSENRVKLSQRISKMYLRCLGFKLHKIIGQRSFQICTGDQI